MAVGFAVFFSGCASDRILQQAALNCPSSDDPQFSELLHELAGVKLVGGNEVTELINGENFFPSMIQAIQNAQHSVNFENFVWRSGEVSDRFIEVLTERARAGVKVRFLVDALGATELNEADVKKLREAGVEVSKYNPVRPWTLHRLNHRTHRKILIVDGKIGFVGGISIADEWLCDTNHPKRWRDSNYHIKGPAVAQLQEIFSVNWTQARGETADCVQCFPPLEKLGSSDAACFMSGPGEGEKNSRRIFLLSIAAAQKNIRIAHSYFLPDNFAQKLLLDARQRGVKIEIITPGVINYNLVRRASRSRWDKLLKAGVEFYEYQPVKYHLKLMIVDDLWVTAGSVNFDERSFRINDEANFITRDSDFAATQIATFELDKSLAERIDTEEFDKRPLREKWYENLAGLLRFQL